MMWDFSSSHLMVCISYSWNKCSPESSKAIINIYTSSYNNNKWLAQEIIFKNSSSKYISLYAQLEIVPLYLAIIYQLYIQIRFCNDFTMEIIIYSEHIQLLCKHHDIYIQCSAIQMTQLYTVLKTNNFIIWHGQIISYIKTLWHWLDAPTLSAEDCWSHPHIWDAITYTTHTGN